MIEFILNDTTITTPSGEGTPLLDFIRYQQYLPGTKIGCREGDCGACTVLVGELKEGEMHYQSMTSCIMPLGNAQGKHVVTVEGLNLDKKLNQVQQALVDEGGTQCGFCTPGFVVSLAGYCLSHEPATPAKALASVDGNICRCTGYKSIERAIQTVFEKLQPKGNTPDLPWLVEQAFLPAYFTHIAERVQALGLPANDETKGKISETYFIGGGTDLYVQKPEEMTGAQLHRMLDNQQLKQIKVHNQQCHMGASATVSDIEKSSVMQQLFPAIGQYAKLISSTQIRNMGTVAGNLVNASPIGDLSIFFLALDATLVLDNQGSQREVLLRNFYKGYKILDKQENEHVKGLSFAVPDANTVFNFEKVSKRTHLDIASVNSAIRLEMNTDGTTVKKAHLSAGGVAPVPFYLSNTSQFLINKAISPATVKEAADIAQKEVAPISDVRGSAAYKKLLLRQLIYAHFITLFDKKITLEDLA